MSSVEAETVIGTSQYTYCRRITLPIFINSYYKTVVGVTGLSNKAICSATASNNYTTKVSDILYRIYNLDGSVYTSNEYYVYALIIGK
jgi:ABC-type uncharacterized transport system permease subunit